jgi:AcrR family transcriptional regulator
MPRDTLTLDQIIRTAVELLDEEGLEGLNMRALGKRLGSAATAVYWHVKSKDELVVLVGDHVWNEVALPDLDAVNWRTAATAMAESLRAMCSRHPWVVQAYGSHLFYGPGKARHDDHVLAVYEAAGFTGGDADRAAAAVFTFVLGSALGASAQAAQSRNRNREGEDAERRLQETMARARDVAVQYPRLRSRLEAPATNAEDYLATPERTFAYGLDALLDGLEAELAARGA